MTSRLPGSFRDPAGSVYLSHDILYRRIEPAGRASYEALMQSGLYDDLVADGLLVGHDDLGAQPHQPGAWTIIRPERVPMISYPYEWSFSQLKDAALLVLTVQERARRHGATLKDASAYNVQFRGGRPVFIDTLSFEPQTGGPWLAYRQFCQHFYAPLLLASVDPRLGRLSQLFIDGVPLALASSLLPKRSWLRPGPLLHLHLHAQAEQKWSADGAAAGERDRPSAGGRDSGVVVDSLRRAVEALRWTPRSAWASYYAERPSYEQEAFDRKRQIVGDWLREIGPAVVWDLGANTGAFSRLAADAGAAVVAFDSDPACVEVMYRDTTRQGSGSLLPLVYDLVNPTPAIGWATEERMTLEQRGPADLLLALALVHHLAVANNVPLHDVLAYFARLARRAIVEFVPRDDAMVRRMMAGRADAFPGYTEEAFEQACAAAFRVEARVPLPPSGRVVYRLAPRG